MFLYKTDIIGLGWEENISNVTSSIYVRLIGIYWTNEQLNLSYILQNRQYTS